MATSAPRAAGAMGGPRILGRLTPELVLHSPQFLNCVGQYELDLRGARLRAVENLGASEDQFEAIDLSDNAIIRLENFPKLLRLRALHASNNKISHVARDLGRALPNLEWLTLTNNDLGRLADLDPLASLGRLRYLSLVDNPASKLPGYRAYVLALLPGLKVLDFVKVREAERREAAAEGVAGVRVPDGVPDEAGAPAAATFEPGEGMDEVESREGAEGAGPGTSGDGADEGGEPAPHVLDATAIKAAIAAASTLDEVRRLEAALGAGHLPSDMREG